MTLNVLLESLRYGLRALVRSPATYALTALILALAIALNTAVFSLVDALSLRPLPYPNSHELYRVLMQHERTLLALGVSLPDAQDLRAGSRHYEDIAVYREAGFAVRVDAEAMRVPGATVTANLFDVLRVRPQLGRTLMAADEAPGAEPVVVIAHELWQARFGLDADVLGRIIRIDGLDRTIVGVMPQYFGFEDFARLWLPLARSSPTFADRADRSWQAIGRLRAGADAHEAGQDLLLRSAHIVGRADPGYDVEHVLAIGVASPDAMAPPPIDRLDDIVRRLGALTGAGAAVSGALPRDRVGPNDSGSFGAASHEAGGEAVHVHLAAVSPGFFDVLGVRLLRGRGFDMRDSDGATAVAVLSRTASERLFGDVDPTGRTVRLGNNMFDIIGVAADRSDVARGRGGMAVTRPRAELYVPAAQGTTRDVVFLLRGDAAALRDVAPRARELLVALEPDRPITFVRPLADDVFQNARVVRWLARIFGTFAAGAVLLTAIGLFGVIAYGVVQRSAEIGIRIALGARPHDVVNLVLTETRRFVGIGLVIGLGTALLVGRVVAGLVYGIRPFDPLTLGAVGALLVLVAALAAYVPARRALRMDPSALLRQT